MRIIFRNRMAVMLRRLAERIEMKELVQGTSKEVPYREFEEVEITVNERDVFSEIADRADRVMEEKRLYLLPDLTLTMLAKEVWSNRTYLSKAIHLRRGMGFRQYVNYYRLKYAKELCKEDFPSLLDLALKSGFSDVRTFNRAADENCGQMDSGLSEL
ncbi:MAG: helix-turn-helix domain-containing protein [Bacteroidales bacterium]|nr:helix-turn-helix domain-containing protein [Bacteroidales bacterium]